MRLPLAALAGTYLAVQAQPALADRASNFTATLIGASADTLGVTVVHDAKGWSMKVRAKPGATEKTISVAAPATHGDYLVFVAAGRSRIAWIEVGDTNGRPKGDEPAVWIYGTATDKVVTIPFKQLFSEDELAAIPFSTAGAYWPDREKQKPTWNGGRLTLPAYVGAPVVIDAAAGSAIRKRVP